MTTDKPPGHDLTSGNVHRSIWYLALPMTLETGIVTIARVLDTYWVGQLGSAAMAAVTISITIRWVINSLSNGMGIGGMAVVARRIGEHDQAAAEHAAWQTILLASTVSLALGGLGLAVARPLLILLGADAEVLPLGLSYLRVTFGGLFTLVLVFAINAMLRGAGEARLAMAVRFLATAVTVILEPVLIFGLGPLPPLGVAGSSWAFVLGFGAGLALQIVILLRGRARIGLHRSAEASTEAQPEGRSRRSLRDLRPDFPLMGRIIRIALPSTVQMVLRSSSRLVIVGLVGLYGTFAIAGYGVANQLLLIALIPSFGLGNAAGTLVGQNLGAHKPSGRSGAPWWVSAYTAGYMAVAATLLFAFARPLIGLFDPTPQVVDIGAECMCIVAPSLVASGVGVVLARAFDGAGDTIPAMTVNLLTLWGMEAPLAYGLAQWLGLGGTGIWWGRAIANLANGLLLAFWFRLGRWKRRKV